MNKFGSCKLKSPLVLTTEYSMCSAHAHMFLTTDRSTLRLGLLFSSLIVAFFAFPFGQEVAGADLSLRPAESLQRVWNDMMLAGNFGGVYNGEAIQTVEGSFARADGWVHETPMTSHAGIIVSDLREPRFLKSHGGWRLEGGVLRRVELREGSIELYGKTIQRHEPYLNPFPHVWIGNESWSFAHEFFLLYRPKGSAQATILRKWVVPDAYDGEAMFVPRGFLEYDSAAQTVLVKVMQGHDMGLFIEQMDVGHVLNP